MNLQTLAAPLEQWEEDMCGGVAWPGVPPCCHSNRIKHYQHQKARRAGNQWKTSHQNLITIINTPVGCWYVIAFWQGGCTNMSPNRWMFGRLGLWLGSRCRLTSPQPDWRLTGSNHLTRNRSACSSHHKTAATVSSNSTRSHKSLVLHLCLCRN